VRDRLRRGELEHEIVEVEVEERTPQPEIPGMDMNMNDVLGNILPKKTKLRKVEVREARKILQAEEEQNLIDMDQVYTEAIERAEQHGIVFLDEIDKVAGKGGGHSGPVLLEMSGCLLSERVTGGGVAELPQLLHHGGNGLGPDRGGSGIIKIDDTHKSTSEFQFNPYILLVTG
jgi:hypothetical protein